MNMVTYRKIFKFIIACGWNKKLCNCHSSFFFFFFLLATFSGWAGKIFLANVSRLVIQKACDQDLSHSLNTPKSIFVKITPKVTIHDVCGTWQDLCMVTSIHSIQKSTRNNQKLGNKLASRWQKIQVSKKREIDLISKQVGRKRKEKILRRLLLHMKQYKIILKNMCHQKM